MGEETFTEKLRRWVGEIGFLLVLWSNRITAEQYMKRCFEEYILWFGAAMKTSKVSDPEKWPSAFEVLHFATPEDAKKAQALFQGMAAEMAALRQANDIPTALKPCDCKMFCDKLKGLPDGKFCMSLAAQEKQRFSVPPKASGHGGE